MAAPRDILSQLSFFQNVQQLTQICMSLLQLMKMLISFDHKSPDFMNLVSLSVNVALNSRCAETMCENGYLEHLKQRTLAYRDPLLMKVLRNLSLHESTKPSFLVSNVFCHIRVKWRIGGGTAAQP